MGFASVLAADAATVAQAAKSELTTVKAIVLGLVEGITEFLPISSTGHLLVTEQLLDIGQSDATKPAMDAYTVIIQLGAILAVLVVSWKRVLSLALGLIGRSDEGKRLLLALLAAFVPTAIIGLALDDVVDRKLLRSGVVAAAWIVGGLAIFALNARYRASKNDGRTLEMLTVRHAVVIGVVQTLAIAWPGMSRSLVTILCAVLLGYRLSAAVEFSFLLGLATLGAASLVKLRDDGPLVFDTFGTFAPLLGMVVAFVSAALAVKWMIGYLNEKDLSVFAWYRVGTGALTLVLLATGAI